MIKKLRFCAVILLGSIFLSASSLGIDITETTCSEWSSGTHDQTACQGDNIVLDTGRTSGNYTSRDLDGGPSATWESINWTYHDAWINDSEAETLPDTETLLLFHFNNQSEHGESTGQEGVVYDFSGNGNDGTLGNDTAGTAPTWSSSGGRFSGGFDFDGASNFIEIPHSSDFLIDNGSVSLWFNARHSDISQTLFSKDSSGYDTGGHFTVSLDQASQINLRIQNTTASYNLHHPFTADEWHYLVVTFGSQGLKLYLNGGLVNESSYTGGLGTSSGGTGNHEPITIGGSTSISGDLVIQPLTSFFDGTIDEVSIWSRAMPGTEILDNYKRGILRINMYIQTSDNTSSWTPWQEMNTSTGSNISAASRYLRYQVLLHSQNSSLTPYLEDVTVSYSEGDTLPPSVAYTLTPKTLQTGENVSIYVNATDVSGVDSVWMEVELPDSSTERINLLNDDTIHYNASIPGTYNITIFANDTLSHTSNVTDSFRADETINVSLKVRDADGNGISASLEMYYSGTLEMVFDGQDSEGIFNISIVEYDYDMLFSVYNDFFELLLRKVPVNSSFNKNISIDDASGVGRFEYVFAVETDYEMNDSLVRMRYDENDFDNKSNIQIYVCDDWDFPGQACDDQWEQIGNITNNETEEIVEFTVNAFSAFGLREKPYCGDGYCEQEENTTSCPDDCFCNNNDTRSCSDTHLGICAVGIETCVSNWWTGCPSPGTETCNNNDDDCDGIIDNVGGGSSVAATQCQCYGSGTPQAETCNGIDDNCDGIIDNNANCCTNGQTRNCGPSSQVGICEFGTSTCTGGIWGSCIGAVVAVTEVCNDGLDNNCDGQTDEDCTSPACGEGIINVSCTCDGSVRASGYCCSGLYSEEECIENSWWILIVAGVIIMVILIALVIHFRSHGKELTWEELRRRYSPSPPSPPPGTWLSLKEFSGKKSKNRRV